MNRQQLAHILRSASRVVDDDDVLVMGSQAILGTYDEDDLPVEATASMEADISFLNDPDLDKSDRVEADLGEMSAFHEMNGYYAQGFSVETAVLPVGWRERLTGWDLESSAPARPWFLERHDLATAKLAAFRDKDKDFVAALIRADMLDVSTLRERVGALPEGVNPQVVSRIQGWLDFFDAGTGRG